MDTGGADENLDQLVQEVYYKAVSSAGISKEVSIIRSVILTPA